VLHRTRAVWIWASPEGHVKRAVEQGDLRATLKTRDAYCRQPPLQLNNSRRTVDESFTDLPALLGHA
jgi:hypothetical protein